MPTVERTCPRQDDLDARMGETALKGVLGRQQSRFILVDDILGRRSARASKGGKDGADTGTVLSENETAMSPQDAALAAEDDELKVRLAHGLLATLIPRHRLMIKLRHGIGTDGGRAYSQDAIGRRFGITGARVGLIEGIAKRRLADMAGEHVKLKEPDNRDVMAFENTKLNPDSAEFARLASLPTEELRARFAIK
jgi:hypothetical protein